MSTNKKTDPLAEAITQALTPTKPTRPIGIIICTAALTTLTIAATTGLAHLIGYLT